MHKLSHYPQIEPLPVHLGKFQDDLLMPLMKIADNCFFKHTTTYSYLLLDT